MQILFALFLARVADQTISKQQQPPGCFSCSSFQQLRRRVECVEMCRAQVQTIARGADAEPRGKFTDGRRFPAPVFPGCGRWRNSYWTQDSQHNCGTSARFSFDVSKSQSDPQLLLKIQHLQIPLSWSTWPLFLTILVIRKKSARPDSQKACGQRKHLELRLVDTESLGRILS